METYKIKAGCKSYDVFRMVISIHLQKYARVLPWCDYSREKIVKILKMQSHSDFKWLIWIYNQIYQPLNNSSIISFSYFHKIQSVTGACAYVHSVCPSKYCIHFHEKSVVPSLQFINNANKSFIKMWHILACLLMCI